MARRKKAQLVKPELNITSMMDLVLNLLTFFVLTSNFAMAELPSLQIPNPSHSTARANQQPNKVVVSILADGDNGAAGFIKMGIYDLQPSDLGRLATLLEIEKKKSPDVTVDLRADKRLRYDQVAPVLAVIASFGIRHVNVVADLSE